LALVFSPTPGKLSYTNTFLNFVLLFHPNSFILILSNHFAQLKKKIKSLDKNPSLYGFSHLMHLTQESLENTLYYKPLVMNFLSLRTNTQHKFCQNPFSKHEHLTQLGLFLLVEALSLAQFSHNLNKNSFFAIISLRKQTFLQRESYLTQFSMNQYLVFFPTITWHFFLHPSPTR
jgi:hypothetical protein